METRAGKTKREKKEEDMRRGLQDDLGRVEEEATGARKRVRRSQDGTLRVAVLAHKNTGQDNSKAKIEDILPSSSAAGVVEENAMEVVDLVSDEDEGFDLAGVGEVGKEAIPAERDNISDEEIDDLLKSDDEDDLTQSSTSIKVRQTGKEDGDALGEVFVSLAMDDDDSAGIVKNKQRKKAEKAKKDKDKWSQLYFMSNRGGQKCKV